MTTEKTASPGQTASAGITANARTTVGRDILAMDARVVRATVGVVSLARPADLARPTPCADWTLGELLAHMIAQHHGWAAAAAGYGGDLSRWRPGPPAADPVREYAAAARRVLAAFAADGVLDRDFALAEISPVLRFPASQAIGFHFIDYVVHGWDVARSLGVDWDLEPDLLAAALAIARAVPDGAARTRARAPFAPGLPVPAESGLLGQILAMLGRSPFWPR